MWQIGHSTISIDNFEILWNCYMIVGDFKLLLTDIVLLKKIIINKINLIKTH